MKNKRATPLDLLEVSIKERLRGYIRQLDLIMKEDPLGIFYLLENGYPSDEQSKGKSKKDKDLERSLNKELKDLMGVMNSYNNGTVGNLCNEVLNHKDFDLYSLYKGFLRPDGSSSLVGDVSTIHIDYMDKSFYNAATLNMNAFIRVLLVKDENGEYKPRMCSNSDYVDTYQSEMMDIAIYNLDLNIYSAIKGKVEYDKFYSRYILLYKKPFLQDFNSLKFLYENTVKVCRRANRELKAMLGKAISRLDYILETFLEKDRTTITPDVIFHVYMLCERIRMYILDHIAYIEKSYNRFLPSGEFLRVPDAYKVRADKERIKEVYNKLKEEIYG